MPAKVELDTLLRDGCETATWRGHRMTGKVTYLSFTRAGTRCIDCDMEVYANTRPAPNEIDLSGDALALDCPSDGRRRNAE